MIVQLFRVDRQVRNCWCQTTQWCYHDIYNNQSVGYKYIIWILVYVMFLKRHQRTNYLYFYDVYLLSWKWLCLWCWLKRQQDRHFPTWVINRYKKVFFVLPSKHFPFLHRMHSTCSKDLKNALKNKNARPTNCFSKTSQQDRHLWHVGDMPQPFPTAYFWTSKLFSSNSGNFLKNNQEMGKWFFNWNFNLIWH